ncbi:hypothetical protein AB1Y20_008991 [Prymnesium parvum]|uniref:Calmodulin-lysine N-methyltransferase n=1 Tax=Prymnesium parvum TaxID=97485 RepID=A0AB34K4C4_PRYPA
MALASPADEAPSLRTLPAELLLEVAVRSPLRLLRLVLRVDVSTAAAMRLQRWFRARRHALPSPPPHPFPVGARVLLRRTAPLARQFATVAAAPEPPSLACRLQLLDGRFVDVSASRLRRLDGWADARWADGVARASARASASAARSAATSAAVAAACALHSGVASDHSALAVAAATAASIAAAAATAASTAAAPAAGTGADEQEATALLLATRQVHEALHGAPAARGTEAAAGEVASLLVKAAASAASDAAAAAGAAAHAAIAADGVGSLPVTASTVAAVASAAGQVASAVEAMRQTSARGADAAGKARLAARTAAEVYADVGSAARALSTAWTGGSEPRSYTFETAKEAAMLLQHTALPTGATRPSDAAPTPPPQYIPLPDRDAVVDFLRRANPALYGPPSAPEGKSARPTAAQTAALDDAALGLCLMMKAAAARSPTGALPADDCPLLYAPTDPRNVWALEGRLHADARIVELPFAAVKVKVQQRWTQSKDAAAPPKPERIEGHSTAAVCWDGSVVLADLLCLPPAVLLSHSPVLARRPSAYAEWRWAQKTVVELGCGISALPSLVAARNGAKCVVSTDGNAEVLRMTRANAAQWRLEHPAATQPLIHPLLWGDRADVVRQLGGVGVEAPVDVILAADCLYVLENPGAWGKLLSTIVALSTPDTLTFVTYTDRGHDKMWRRFLEQRVQKLFHVVLVADHLLHPNARPGSHGRLEQSKPVQVYCLSLLDTSKLAESAIPVPASC